MGKLEATSHSFRKVRTTQRRELQCVFLLGQKYLFLWPTQNFLRLVKLILKSRFSLNNCFLNYYRCIFIKCPDQTKILKYVYCFTNLRQFWVGQMNKYFCPHKKTHCSFLLWDVLTFLNEWEDASSFSETRNSGLFSTPYKKHCTLKIIKTSGTWDKFAFIRLRFLSIEGVFMSLILFFGPWGF